MSNPILTRLLTGLFYGFALATNASEARGTEAAVPNLSSIDFPWMATAAEYAAPASGLGPFTYDHAHPIIVRQANNVGAVVERPLQIADLNNPNLKPWVVDFMKKANDETLAGKVRSASRASCRPPGVPEFLVHGAGFRAMYIVQTAKEILLITDANMQVRHIYMNVEHSSNLKPSYHGESVGHYEGDQLVVDTIGFNDKTLLDDRYNVPHTTQLHVVERLKLLQDGRMLEADFTVDDPGAFNAPWSGVVRYRRPGQPRPFEEESCPEEAAAGSSQHFPVPIADKPDF
jgi:hypothetical protein